MWWLWLIIPAVIVIFVIVLLIRTAMFKPKKEEKTEFEEIKIDADEAVYNLSQLIKCKTVSYYDHSKEDDAEFEKLVELLPRLYPNVINTCELKRFDGRALLYRWKGRKEGDPAVMMAHYDVVPVVEEDWTKPAFEGLLENGILWGRGTLDTKETFNGIMTAANRLIGEGFVPEYDIYFAFSGGEEVSGPGAGNIVGYFKQNNITPSLVIDEGGGVVDDIFPGVKASCGLIGIAEKGLMNVEFKVKSNGGHASAPAPHTPVGVLAMACAKVEAHPFKAYVTKPIAEMFDTLGRHSTFVYRLIFANRWCFGKILDRICVKSGGELNALMRTTVAFTQMNGSDAPNVVPPQASMVANIRLNPMDTVESATAYLKKTVDDDKVEISVLEGEDPSRISRTDVKGWEIVKNAVSATWKGCLISPYLMMQCSDSRRYSPISDRVYRFSAIDLSKDERKTIHGNDEHIRTEVCARAVEFFFRVMKSC